MNGNRNGRNNQARLNKTIKVAPTTRAIRAALAVSATMLALAGSGVAYAGNCSVSALNTVSCNGVFTDTIIGFVPTDDLTLILGDTAPTSVTPGLGDEGLVAIWSNVTVVSYADITTEAADGIYANSGDSVSVTNHGGITTDATLNENANAIHAQANYDVTVVNDGDLFAYSNYGAGDVTAVYAGSFAGTVMIDNQADGDIQASSYSGDAYGALALSLLGDAIVNNDGSIAAYSFSGDAAAAVAVSVDGEASVTNAGHIEAYSLSGKVIGAAAYSLEADANVDNSGDIHVGTVYGDAVGAYATALYGTADVTNSGSIEATSIFGDAYGAYASGTQGYASVTNTDTGSLDVTAYDYAVGVLANGYFGAAVENAGSITTYGFVSYGAVARSDDGNASVTNTETGSIDAEGFYAVGIYVDGFTADASNAGSVASSGEFATGITAYGYDYAGVVNAETGSVDATGYASAVGVSVDSYNSAAAHNYGDITVLADGLNANAAGVSANSDHGEVYVFNAGSISSTSVDGDAYGILTTTFGLGDIAVDNAGSITATGYYWVNGVAAWAYGDGAASVTNSGSIDATGYTVVGAYAWTDGVGDATVTNTATGSITATSYAGNAYGIRAWADYDGDAHVTNDGSVTAHGYTAAVGIYAYAWDYDATVTTGADSTTSASADEYAAGVSAYGWDNAFVDNGGSISAEAFGENGLGYAVGAFAKSALDVASVYNSGDIEATAGGYGAYALGAGAYTYGEYGTAVIANNGSITATATGSGFATAYGATAGSQDYWAVVLNGADGSIDAHAHGYYEASATGVSAIGVGAAVYSEGSISATAEASGDYGSAYATGVFAAGIYAADFSSASGSSIEASASGYYAYATGVFVASYVNVAVDNGGDIDAFASGVYGGATGMVVYALGDVAVYNSGDITAEFDGDYGYAAGVEVFSYFGDAYFHNDGSISAAGGYAYGVSLFSGHYTELVNHGTITADTAVWTGASADEIWNYGTINGAVYTGAGNDVFYNADSGVWNATGASYFGAGDDLVYNNGTIHMTDAAIYLGSYSEYGNNFVNFGVVSVSGDNWIDMGWAPADTLIPSENPNPFYNYGVIDFQDGHPDDTLVIVGDFAGDGDINVDVSAIHGSSDVLYIDGSVVDGTSTINPDVVDTPTSEFTEIPMVYVTGNSGSGNFALGEVGMDLVHTFLTFDFNLVSDVDASNESDDMYSLAIDVTGLSDPGALAASVVPGVQSLANAQVGTWRQRAGVITKFQDSSFSLWARWFQNDGTISPDHVATNFGQGGNFDFDQKNSGFEVGADFSISEEFSVGLLAAQTKADQDLNVPGAGSTEIDADTYGVYATWLSNGFYVDGSYRWLSFTADSTSVAGAMSVDGDAETFNIEAGYAWTLEGGLQIEPQAQYTNTKVSDVDAAVLGQTTFQADDGTSEVGRVGVSFRKGFGDADNGTLWTPYATLSAVWEMDGENAYTINGSDFAGHTSTDGSSGLLELGLTAQTGNLSVFGGINWQDGGALDSFVGGQLGVRYTFGHAAPAPAPVAPPPAKTCADLDDDGDGVNNCDDKCPGSAAGQAIGPDGCPVPLTIDLKGVNFDFDKATLRPDAVAILDEAISILGKYPELKVEVAGHTDSKGTDEYNQALSERRAKAVYDYLAAHAIGTERMVGPIGYGESKPIAPNSNEDGSDNPDGRAKNRRTELNVQN